MLSAQCDELRELATRYDELQVGAVKAVTMPSDMGSVLREAADTIWELRDSVHRERAEADRLREELADAPKCEVCEAMLDCDECLRADSSQKERRQLEAENAKLRELVADVHEALCSDKAGMFHELILASMEDDMRELGVEVDV